MAVAIQIRRDTALNWTTANPVLALGEMGIETDTDKVKYGDGITAWSSLAYLVEPSVEEAPIDGTKYGRLNAAWEAITEGITDAPSDGVPYNRKDGAWVSSVETTGANKIDAIEVVSALPGTPDANTLYMVV